MRELRTAATMLVHECLASGSQIGGIATNIGESAVFLFEISMDQKQDGALQGFGLEADSRSDIQVLDGPSWA